MVDGQVAHDCIRICLAKKLYRLHDTDIDCRKWPAHSSSAFILEYAWTYTDKIAGRIDLSVWGADDFIPLTFDRYTILRKEQQEQVSNIQNCRLRAVLELSDTLRRRIQARIGKYPFKSRTQIQYKYIRDVFWIVVLFNTHDLISGHRGRLRQSD